MSDFFKIFKMNLILQKKTSFSGIIITIIPMLITALAIEMFIGKILFGDNHSYSGLKAINVCMFFLISNMITSSSDALHSSKTFLKNSFMQPKYVILSNCLIQFLTILILLIILSFFFNFTFFLFIKTFILFFITFILMSFVSTYVACTSLVFNDMSRILGIVFQLIFWLSPIIYGIRDVQSSYSDLLLFNPFFIFYELILLSFDFSFFEISYLYVPILSFSIFLFIIIIALKQLKNEIKLYI
jgi:ABC-type polysaccharide/polyol phosphate export permease